MLDEDFDERKHNARHDVARCNVMSSTGGWGNVLSWTHQQAGYECSPRTRRYTGVVTFVRSWNSPIFLARQRKESVDQERFGANPVLKEGAKTSKESNHHSTNMVCTNHEAKWWVDAARAASQPWTVRFANRMVPNRRSNLLLRCCTGHKDAHVQEDMWCPCSVSVGNATWKFDSCQAPIASCWQVSQSKPAATVTRYWRTCAISRMHHVHGIWELAASCRDMWRWRSWSCEWFRRCRWITSSFWENGVAQCTSRSSATSAMLCPPCHPTHHFFFYWQVGDLDLCHQVFR